MSQLALYRKYRSSSLDDIIGQKHITQTLAAAIKQGKLSHAYLFTGPRGTGKTSIARILARTINNIQPENEATNYLDIVEIDAASNRGIDEIRALRERVAVAPAELQYKVYIIDEAHMLTREAFNALLKTLEEPPAHVVFILATTESHKLPETIISRTQRYDFHPLTEEEISAQLQFIAKAEKINITPEATQLMAQLSGGGLRDAIGLLDQMAVLEGTIDEAITSQFLGLAPDSEIIEVLNLCHTADSLGALSVTKKIVASGVAANELIMQLQKMSSLKLLEAINSKDIGLQQFYIMALDILHSSAAKLPFTANATIPLQLAVAKLSQYATKDSAPVLATATTKPVLPKSKVAQPLNEQPSQPQEEPPNSDQNDIALCDKALSTIKENNNSLYALLRSGNANVQGSKLLVKCRFAFHKNRIEEHYNRAMIEKEMSKVFKRPIQLNCSLNTAPQKEEANPESELVNSAMAILGGELVE